MDHVVVQIPRTKKNNVYIKGNWLHHQNHHFHLHMYTSRMVHGTLKKSERFKSFNSGDRIDLKSAPKQIPASFALALYGHLLLSLRVSV